LGRKLLRGEGAPKDTKRAFALISEAAEAGNPDAMGAMGYFYASSVEVQQDLSKAAEWFRRGAEAGSVKAQFNYGTALLKGSGVKTNEAAGVDWIKKAAAAGLPEAQSRMGFGYLHGDLPGIGVDRTAAREMLLPAAEAGIAEAQNALGFLLGGDSEHEASLVWYRRAAEQGFSRAQANLGSVLFNGAAPDDRAQRVEGLKWLLLAEGVRDHTAVKMLREIMPACSAAEVDAARQAADVFNASPGRSN
jgi:TPR repeat protein